MSHDDDDLLAPYDLTAWEAPPPPAGLADRVIAAARQPLGAAAVEPAAPASTRMRAWIAGGVALASVAAAAFVAFGVERQPADGRGEVIADRARVLELGPTKATLDPGAEVRWSRDGRRITATQQGAVTWTVDEEDTLVIDAGATVASVEAHGGSLRVEVPMNQLDVRVIGVSGATAVAAALLTVVVYEGHVNVQRGSGETVHVAAGATYVVPPATPEQDDELVATTARELAEMQRELEATKAEMDRLRAELDGHDTRRPAATVAPDPKLYDPPAPETSATCDEVSCVLNGNNGACCAKYKKTPVRAQAEDDVPDNLDRDAIRKGMQPILADVRACDRNDYTGKLKLVLTVGPSGRVVKSSVTGVPKLPAPLSSCVLKAAREATFPAAKEPTSFGYPISIAADEKSAPASCDVDALRRKGDDHLQTGMDAAALASFEAAIRCKPDASLIQKAFMSACRSKNTGKARLYFAKLPASKQSTLSMICIRNGVNVNP